MRAFESIVGMCLVTACFATFQPVAQAGQATPQRCNGFNLLDKLAATDPAVHERIVNDAATIENGQAVLWKIERAGRLASHLFGTVHLSDERVTRLSDATQVRLTNARSVIIENSDLSPEAAARAYEAASRSALFSDGRTLDKLLSPDEFAKVRQSVNGTAASLRPYRPWIVSLMLSASECERDRVKNGHLVLDLALVNLAKRNGIPVAGLESTEDQLSALASIPDDEQLGMLRANIALMDETENLMETMVQLYLARRVGALWDLQIALSEKAGVPAKAFTAFQNTIIVERNRKMRDASLPYLEKGGAFIAVGALHLPSSTGLVALLRESGYTVTAIE